MAATPVEGLPTTAQAVHGLHERRDILRDQLVRATNRRSELVNQLDQDMPAEAREGLQQRLAMLDERILQIEQDQALTERQLSSASPELLARAEQVARPSNVVDEGEAVAVAFGAFGAGILLAVFVGRVRRRFRRRPAAAPALALGQDPRVDQLMTAVDAIAEEVERIGEGQRFVTQLLASRPDAAAQVQDAERR